MLLDAELKDVLQAKALLAARSDLSRQVIHLELLALRTRTRQAFSGLSLGLGLAGKALDYLRARRCR
jgi:hypothetical protein